LKIVRNPVVLFEVLSPSTAGKDRIVKAREYQATPSVQRYVMLEQDRIGATVHVRAADGWSVIVLKDDDTLALPEIGLAIPLAEFYEGLTFEDQPAEDTDNGRRPLPPEPFARSDRAGAQPFPHISAEPSSRVPEPRAFVRPSCALSRPLPPP